MFVINRRGNQEKLCITKIISRIEDLRNREPILQNVDAEQLSLETIKAIKQNMSTSDIDAYTAKVAETLSIEHPEYYVMAARIIIDSHHKNTLESFRDKMQIIYRHSTKDGYLKEEFYKYIEKHSKQIQDIIDYSRDYKLGYFGMCIFLNQFGFKIGKNTIERLQDMYMRIAIYLNAGDYTTFNVLGITATYDALSLHKYTHASPTYYNAGTIHSQLASCFLLGMDDSTGGILHTITNCAEISRRSGGIGLHIENIRSSNSPIRSIVNGTSNGPIPFIKIIEAAMEAFNQGGRRPGAAAIYIPVWHSDIESIVDLRLPNGDAKKRARGLFYSMWVPNIFMKRLADPNAVWSLFNPDRIYQATGKMLSNYYDDGYTGDNAFTKFYEELESAKLYDKQIKPLDLLRQIYEVNKQTGIPYICFSDHANTMSNYKHIGVINSSNLCTEIYQYSDATEYAVCTLCSISLPAMVRIDDTNNNAFDFDELRKTVKLCITNLNIMVDKNSYPCKESEAGSLRHRPIGLGSQGLADVYMMLGYAYDSPEARILNKRIYETIYYAALAHSVELSYEYRKEYIKTNKLNPRDVPKTYGAFSTFAGSPLSKGIFHWELYGLTTSDLWHIDADTTKYDWESLRSKLMIYGCRNIVMISVQPTASTSQLMNNNEACEPFTSNFYNRSTATAELTVFNRHLVNTLHSLGIWSKELRECLLASQGSVQYIDGLPDNVKKIYLTAYEMNQAEILQQAIDRAPFIDQGQSTNWFVENLSFKLFCQLLNMAFKGKLKTAKYYLHTKPATSANKFTIDPSLQALIEERMSNDSKRRLAVHTVQEKQVCEACSS